MRPCTKKVQVASALLLAGLSGLAIAQPLAITGVKKAAYGNPRFVNMIPTNYGDNNVVACDPNTLGGATVNTVTTGVEIAIPLTALGSPTGTIRCTAFINSGDGAFASNQWSGSPLVGPTGELATPTNMGETRSINLATDVRAPGNQFFTINLNAAGTAPTIDGTRDAAGWTTRAQQGARTYFGDSNSGNVDNANGSEIDGCYVRVAGGVLYMFFTGNLESNGNNLEIFFDTGAPLGQNNLRTDNPAVGGDGNHLNRMGNDGILPGLTFDTGFSANYWVGVNGTGAPYAMYVDYAKLSNSDGSGGGAGFYCGSGTAVSDGTLSGGVEGAPAIRATINNSNILGVPAICPPPAGNPNTANGSEIDAVYSYVDKANKRLYVLATGNVKTDYTSLNLFFDVGGFMTPGGEELGQNRLRNDNSGFDFGSINNMGGPGVDANPTNPGLKFDNDFSATYFLSYKNGEAAVQNYSHATVLRTAGRATVCDAIVDYGMFDGGPKTAPGANGQQYDVIKYNGLQGYPGGTTEPFIGIQEQDGTKTELEGNFAPFAGHNFMVEYIVAPCGGGNTSAPKPAAGIILMRMDQSNQGGVTSANGGAAFTEDDVIAVQTGCEFSIDLAELGYDGVSDIKLAGWIGAGDRGTISNQVIGGVPASYGASPGTSVGTTNATDLSAIAGQQWVQIYKTCPADLNNDGFTDDSDFVIFAAAYNELIAPSRWAAGDLDGDGFVDDTDFVIFAAAYNELLCPNIME
ncbi:MAG: hypothetical protein JNK16_00160 [Phycisphaerales bacterium]|nr:hypothetical protein [Phycisphaerales bacterium]